MSFPNPTPVKIGMSGTFDGTRYQVVGRVVMGVIEDGQSYYWSEFNLETDSGASAILVYERTERGSEWRFFAMFEPQYPITAEDAATKRVGDRLNLDGTDVRVTLIEQSRVYFIEGRAPEGVEVGDVANYFNAEGGGNMDVVSWTGEDVECYHGINLPWSAVAGAFNIRLPDFSSQLATSEADSGSSRLHTGALVAVIALIVVIAACLCLLPHGRRPAIVRTSAPAPPLRVGNAGKLKGTQFRIQSHAVAEVALVGQKFERHEYTLADENGDPALLVCGLRPGGREWILYTPRHPAEPMTPQQAGAVRWGQTVTVDGLSAKVSDLFQTTLRRVEGPEADASRQGEVLYGFAGKGDYYQLLARWNASRIEFFSGYALPEKEVTAAFKARP
jgi:hypothetical protein